MHYYKIDEISREVALNKFIDEGEVSFQSYILSSNEEQYLIDILKQILHEIGKPNTFEFLSYCYRELLTNAKKSNTKRVYFEDIGLDINNSADYKNGMKNFKNILLNKSEEYLKIQEERGYYIRNSFTVNDDDFIISIMSNTKIQEEEIKIIEDRKQKSKAFNSIDEALQIILNNEEGAGLGIIISLLMLKKLGLSTNNYDIKYENGETISSLTIPLTLMTEEQIGHINSLFEKEIDGLPFFPENIIDLQKKIGDPNVDIKNISLIISRDPGLTGEVLKFANSALFSLPKKISSLIEAIKIVGLRGLRNLIYSYQTKTIFSKKYNINKMQALWDHSYKVGFFAFYLAKKFSLKEILEDVYIGGILHDLGKILTFSMNEEIVSKMNNLCQERGISIKVIEEISNGYNHSLIGGALAKKWNFPEKFVYAIENHHSPEAAIDNESLKSFLFCIYLANIMDNDKLINDRDFNQIDSSVLNFFKIGNYERYKELVTEIKEHFLKQKI